jgi:hypothetical protein
MNQSDISLVTVGQIHVRASTLGVFDSIWPQEQGQYHLVPLPDIEKDYKKKRFRS